jgi:hypothetical protein
MTCGSPISQQELIPAGLGSLKYKPAGRLVDFLSRRDFRSAADAFIWMFCHFFYSYVLRPIEKQKSAVNYLRDTFALVNRTSMMNDTRLP